MLTLFDATPYGPERKPRHKTERPDEIRLEPPWVLLRSHNTPPTAHLLATVVKATERDQIAARNGAVRTRCERYGLPLDVPGTPMTRVCHTCWDLLQRQEPGARHTV